VSLIKPSYPYQNKYEYESQPKFLRKYTKIEALIFYVSFIPGEKIFSENEMSLPFYFVVASEETADSAEVEVLKDAGGSEKLMTRLRRGEYIY
jgi:hypothetical protein